LADAFDDLHIRKICFGYGTSPQRLMRMMNRASASSNQEAAEEEGLMPWVEWTQGVINFIIQRKAGYSDYELQFNPYQELDINKLSVAMSTLVDNGLRTPNEGREALGDDPSSEEGANDLGIKIATGRVPLALVVPTPPSPEGALGTPSGASEGAKNRVKKPLGATDAAEKALQVLKYKYGAVMVAIPEESPAGQALVKMRSRIANEHLRAKGLEKEPHVTVRYGFSGDTAPIREYLMKQAPIKIKLGKTFAFDPSENSDGAAPVCIKIESLDLERMNAELADHGTWKTPDFEYHPHATLGYVSPEFASEYVDMDDADGQELEISNVLISEAYLGGKS
jgi:2'-5' RNA ligase